MPDSDDDSQANAPCPRCHRRGHVEERCLLAPGSGAALTFNKCFVPPHRPSTPAICLGSTETCKTPIRPL